MELVSAGIAELTASKGGGVWARREAPESSRPRLEAAVASADTQVLVGTLDEIVVGYAITRVEVLRDGSRLGVIEEIFVQESARGVGVGEALMRDIQAWLLERGCFGADALALPGQRVTKNFFEESGFTARKLVMHHTFARET